MLTRTTKPETLTQRPMSLLLRSERNSERDDNKILYFLWFSLIITGTFSPNAVNKCHRILHVAQDRYPRNGMPYGPDPLGQDGNSPRRLDPEALQLEREGNARYGSILR